MLRVFRCFNELENFQREKSPEIHVGYSFGTDTGAIQRPFHAG